MIVAAPVTCASPSYDDCVIACANNRTCPKEFRCVQGLCTRQQACNRSRADAHESRDASADDPLTDASLDVGPGSGGASGSGGAQPQGEMVDGQGPMGGRVGDAGIAAGGRGPAPGRAVGDANVDDVVSCDKCREPHPIALDSTNVYWTSRRSDGNGFVYTAPLSGGTPTILAFGQPELSLVVDPTSVYYFDPAGANGRLVQLPLSGAMPQTVSSGAVSTWSTIAVDGTSAYWARVDNINQNSIVKAALTGGAQTVLAERLPGTGALGLAVDSTSVYWANRVDWSDPRSDLVMKVAITGGAPKVLAVGVSAGYGLAVDATNVYWTGGDAVMKVPLDGGTPTTLASGQNNPNSITVDSVNVYWTTQGSEKKHDATVMRVAVGGGTPTVIASGERGLWGLAIDATRVYWVDPVSDTVKSAPK